MNRHLAFIYGAENEMGYNYWLATENGKFMVSEEIFNLLDVGSANFYVFMLFTEFRRFHCTLSTAP